MSEVRYYDISENKQVSKVNLVLIGNAIHSIFESFSIDFSSLSEIGQVNILQTDSNSEGIDVVSDSCVNVCISPAVSGNKSVDIIEVKRAAQRYLDHIGDMISLSDVNLLVSVTGDDFTSAMIPEIAQLSRNSDSITIAVLILPHPDDGFSALHKASHALKTSIPCFNSFVQIPIHRVYEILSGSAHMQNLSDYASLMIAQVTTALLMGITSTKYSFSRNNDEHINFFHDSGELLLSWVPLDISREDVSTSVTRCLQEPIHDFEQFERAKRLFVSVGIAQSGIPVDHYLKIGQNFRARLGNETDVLVKPFTSFFPDDRPFFVTFARDFLKKRSERFDYPVTPDMYDKAPSDLPAVYRKRFGTSKGGSRNDL